MQAGRGDRRRAAVGRLALGVAVLALALLAGCGEDGERPTPPGEVNNNDPNNNPDNNLNNDPAGNRAPTLARIGSKRAQIGRELSFVVEGSDPDGDPLSFSIIGDLPEGARFDKEARRFLWKPLDSQLDQLVLLTFSVSDGLLDDRETVQMTVVEQGDNAPPELSDPGDQVLRPSQPFTLQLQATDPDGDPLTFGIDGPSPQGSALDAATGRFEWTPTPEDAGASIRVLFFASDGAGRADARVRLIVSELALTLGEIPAREVRLGETIRFTLPLDNPAMIPTTCGTLGATLPGTDFDPATCAFSWTPTDPALVGTTTEFAFQILFEDEGEPARLIAVAPVTVLSAEPAQERCVADRSEPNNARSSATAINDNPFQAQGLTICGDDQDFFAVDLERGERLSVSLTFSHAQGDIDALILGAAGDSPLAVADSVTDNEELALDQAPQTGTYFVVVLGVGNLNARYDIEIAREGAACANDPFEPNNARERPAVVESPFADEGRICPSDIDFFAIDLDGGQLLRATAIFDAMYDLDLTILSPDGQTWTSEGVTDTEELIIPGLPLSGRYLIKVFGFQPQDDALYLLEIVAEPAAECEADTLEPNDAPPSARRLIGDVDLRGLTACGDPDFYRVTLEPGEELLVLVGTARASHMRMRLLGGDGITPLTDPITEADDPLYAEAGPFLSRQDVLIVLDTALGVTYSLETLIVPSL